MCTPAPLAEGVAVPQPHAAACGMEGQGDQASTSPEAKPPQWSADSHRNHPLTPPANMVSHSWCHQCSEADCPCTWGVHRPGVERGSRVPLFMLRDASLARPKRKAHRPQNMTCWLDNWAHLVSSHDHMKQWHGVASAAGAAHLPAELGACPAKVRKLLELQKLNPPALSVTARACCCPKRIQVFHIGAQWEQNFPLRGWWCGVPRQRYGQCAEMLMLDTAPLPLGTEGCSSSCPNENKVSLFSVVLTAMLKSSHFPTKERPSEKPKQTLAQATLEAGLSYKHRKLNTKPCYNSVEDLT